MGSGGSWLAALHLMAHGNHHVTIDTADGRLAVVLEHHDDDHHHHHDHAPASTHPHPSDDDHVVTIASPDVASVTSARHPLSDCGPSATLSSFAPLPPLRIDLAHRAVRARVGPLTPARSSILRI